MVTRKKCDLHLSCDLQSGRADALRWRVLSGMTSHQTSVRPSVPRCQLSRRHASGRSSQWHQPLSEVPHQWHQLPSEVPHHTLACSAHPVGMGNILRVMCYSNGWHGVQRFERNKGVYQFTVKPLYSEQSRLPTCSLYRGVHARASPRFSYSISLTFSFWLLDEF